jgi:ubiquinone/menaquinone biosynthesis C-methylase UbiE
MESGMALKKVDYDGRQHTVYAAGRVMTEENRALWMSVFAAQLPATRPLTIVDLGSGVGRLTPAQAATFGGPIYGVEPSAKMREIAGTAPHAGAEYLAGEAARIPLDDAVADAVLMFMSFHHVPDRPAAAVEIRRVLRPGGRLLIHSGFSDRMRARPFWWHQFFPKALEIELQMFPSMAEVAEVFAPVGLKPLTLVETPLQFWTSATEAAERLRLRPFSTFEHMTEAEIVEGLARLDAAVAAETAPAPIIGISDLLVLG